MRTGRIKMITKSLPAFVFALVAVLTLLHLVVMAADKGATPAVSRVIKEGAELSVNDLEGIWTPISSLKRLIETQSAHASQPHQITIKSVNDGSGFKLEHTNFHEGLSYNLVSIDPTDKQNLHLLVLTREDSSGLNRKVFREELKIPLKLGVAASGKVVTIKFLTSELSGVPPNDPFVRIPMPWPKQLNIVLFAGSWRDGTGRTFSFTKSGRFHLQGRKARDYEVSVDSQDARCDLIKFDKPIALVTSEEPAHAYGYKRLKNELRFFRFRTGLGSCDDSPILILKKE
jgi:hypothetical protein